MGEEQSAQEAVQVLFNQYASDVYRYARILLSNHDDAKDVVQEVFVRAYRSWNGFRKDANPKTWLISITRNCVFSLLRERKRERDFLTSYQPPYIRDESEMLETLCILEESIAQLKDTYRQVIMLRHIENFSVLETSQILGWSESKVTTTAQRAMRKLREILEVTADKGVKIRNEIKTQHS